MLAALQHQTGGARQRLGGVFQRLGPGQAALHGAVGQGFHKQVGKGRAAAAHSAARVDQVLLQPVQPAGGGHALTEGRLFLLTHAVGGAEDHALADGAGGVGHNADHRVVGPDHLPDAGNGQACGHGHQHKAPPIPVTGRQHRGNALQHIRHHLGLYTQKDIVGLFGHARVFGHGHRRALLFQPGRQCLRLGPGAVGQQHPAYPALAGGRGQRAAHVAAADESKGFFAHTSLPGAVPRHVEVCAASGSALPV